MQTLAGLKMACPSLLHFAGLLSQSGPALRNHKRGLTYTVLFFGFLHSLSSCRAVRAQGSCESAEWVRCFFLMREINNNNNK